MTRRCTACGGDADPTTLCPHPIDLTRPTTTSIHLLIGKGGCGALLIDEPVTANPLRVTCPKCLANYGGTAEDGSMNDETAEQAAQRIYNHGGYHGSQADTEDAMRAFILGAEWAKANPCPMRCGGEH